MLKHLGKVLPLLVIGQEPSGLSLQFGLYVSYHLVLHIQAPI